MKFNSAGGLSRVNIRQLGGNWWFKKEWLT